MNAYVFFDTTYYLIEFVPFMGTNIKKYQKEFEKWYYEAKTEILNGKRCICYVQRKDLPYKYFNLDPIFDWMKER